MLNIKQANGGGNSQKYDYIPDEGVHLGVIIQVLDLGIQEQRPFQGKPKDPARMIRVTYELSHELRDFDGEEKPLIVSEEFPFFSSEKSRCYKRLNAIDPGFKNTGGDWSKTAGKAVQVQIVHRTVEKDGGSKTYANIGSVSPLMKGMAAPEETFNDVLVYSTDTPDAEVFDKLPEFLQEKITKGGGAPQSSGQSTKKGKPSGQDKGVADDVSNDDSSTDSSDSEW